MIYLLAFFCSPLALLLTGKPFQALANLVLYVLSIALWITIIFHHAGFVLWPSACCIRSSPSITRARNAERAGLLPPPGRISRPSCRSFTNVGFC